MANSEHLKIFKSGKEKWNSWRNQNPYIIPDLSNSNFDSVSFKDLDFRDCHFENSSFKKAKFNCCNLDGVYLVDCNLEKININKSSFLDSTLTNNNFANAKITNSYFYNADLGDSNFENSLLETLELQYAKLSDSNIISSKVFNCEFIHSDLSDSNLSKTIIESSNFFGSSLMDVNLSNTIIIESDFGDTNLSNATIENSKITNSIFENCIMVETSLDRSILEKINIYGLSAWNLSTKETIQREIIITKSDEPKIEVDNIEIGQFLYLILNNSKIRDVISSIGKKGVLILGRFTTERKRILNGIRKELRLNGYIPIVFDFKKIEERDFTETIKILAGLSKFVIADITNPSSIPLELQAIVPNYKIPLLPIIQKGERPFAMFIDLQIKYNWVLPVFEYKDLDNIVSNFQELIIERAIKLEERLILEKSQFIVKKFDLK